MRRIRARVLLVAIAAGCPAAPNTAGGIKQVPVRPALAQVAGDAQPTLDAWAKRSAGATPSIGSARGTRPYLRGGVAGTITAHLRFL